MELGADRVEVLNDLRLFECFSKSGVACLDVLQACIGDVDRVNIPGVRVLYNEFLVLDVLEEPVIDVFLPEGALGVSRAGVNQKWFLVIRLILVGFDYLHQV